VVVAEASLSLYFSFLATKGAFQQRGEEIYGI
jgi:hypothetical protein